MLEQGALKRALHLQWSKMEVLLCNNPSSPVTGFVEQAGLELTEIHLLLSGIKVVCPPYLTQNGRF